jgi:hypothetical protein
MPRETGITFYLFRNINYLNASIQINYNRNKSAIKGHIRTNPEQPTYSEVLAVGGEC